MSTPAPQPPVPAATWVADAAGSGFDVDHLPYGADAARGLVVRIGHHALVLGDAARRLRPDLAPAVDAPTLDALLAAGPDAWADVRAWVTALLTDERHRDDVGLVPVADLDLVLPFAVADYVDYYASIHHATTVGRIMRPDAEPLLPNWRHLPVAYHGRAGSVVVSGTPVRRPAGQRAGADDHPTFGPTERLDLEAELGFVVGRRTAHGDRVATSELARTVLGVVGLNDWSARDVQTWEYRPLGPNLSKSFATSIGAWVTPLAALDAARVPLPEQRPAVLPYLRDDPLTGYDVDVEVEINGTVVARPSFRSMYWSPAQMLAHLTVNGAVLRPGDLFGSGTISGPEPHEQGCLLELTWGGTRAVEVGPPEQPGRRFFLEDGDEVVLRYAAPGRLGPITLGDVRGVVLPAHPTTTEKVAP